MIISLSLILVIIRNLLDGQKFIMLITLSLKKGCAFVNDAIINNFIRQKQIFNTEKFKIGDVIKISFNDESVLEATSQFAFVTNVNEDYIVITIPDTKTGYTTTKITIGDLNYISNIEFLNEKDVNLNVSDN